MTFKQQRRKIEKKIFPPLVWAFIRLVWKTCRVQTVIGEEHLQTAAGSGEPCIPCYWHQQQIFCVWHLLQARDKLPQLKLGYLISPSADGDMATNMFGGQGVHIIRGSATRGGAQALREIYTAVRKDKISPIVTPDGPTGPVFKTKPGVAMLAQLSRAPLLPMAYAGNRIWRLRSWDGFMLPMPFSRVVVGIGEPLSVNKVMSEDNFSLACEQLDERLNALVQSCEAAIADFQATEQ